MEKYVGAVVRKSSQLIIDEEIDHFENKIPVQKNLQVSIAKSLSKKTKLYCTQVCGATHVGRWG